MRELAPGLWHWEAPHPDWQPSEPWGKEVSSYAIDDGERLMLFDPLAVPSEIEELAGDREPAVVLTVPWHERDTQSLVERLGAPVFAPPPDTQQDLMQKFGVTAEQAAGGSPDLAWLLAGNAAEKHLYSAGDRLPFGVEAFAGREHNDMVLWIQSHRTVIAGDTLVDFGRGLEIPLEWLRRGVTREQVIEGLRPLLALPVERVLATHGGPSDRAALERALL
ncbi:MAG TPA: MBL fold metallo-hydrolase [Gaiellaceae bacterium]|nr:MBL fold metallo-hydrolase [Gaiellaceae bacterium]